MRILKTVVLLLLGMLVGIAGHMAWQALLNRPAHAFGVLQQEPEAHTAVSASHPTGFFVESRVYLETASPDMLGKRVTAWGNLGLAKDFDAPSYPKIGNKQLTVVR